MTKAKKVALLIETSTSYGRTLIRGILQYANAATSWILYNEPRGFSDELPSLSGRNFDGIIMRDTKGNMPLLKLGIPTVVSIRYEKQIDNVPNIISDSEKIGKLAAEYLTSKGFENFAFCGFDNMPWSLEREKVFRNAINGKTYVFQKNNKQADYNQQLKEMAQWLKSLPKPIGLMACNDVRGANVIEACKLANIKIPQEISILGVNDDDMICEMTSPPLSSISLDIARGGYEAARTLDIMMREGIDNISNIIIKPKDVVTRSSTNILTIDDPDVARALYFISENSRQNIQVTDVADHVGINRRSLERRFRKILDKSVYDEIKRLRIETMSKMLTETDIPISEIAYKMGFNDANHIARYFKLEKGISPLDYRKSHAADSL